MKNTMKGWVNVHAQRTDRAPMATYFPPTDARPDEFFTLELPGDSHVTVGTYGGGVSVDMAGSAHLFLTRDQVVATVAALEAALRVAEARQEVAA